MSEVFDAYTTENSKHIIVVTSENNLAVDAVATSILTKCKHDYAHPLIEKTLSVGSDAMGANTELFRLESKVERHPDVRDKLGEIEDLKNQRASLWGSRFIHRFKVMFGTFRPENKNRLKTFIASLIKRKEQADKSKIPHVTTVKTESKKMMKKISGRYRQPCTLNTFPNCE